LTTGIIGQGTILPSPGTHAYDKGEQIALSATPAAGYTFECWLLQDGSQISNATATLTLTNSQSAIAVFTAIGNPTSEPIPTPVVIFISASSVILISYVIYWAFKVHTRLLKLMAL